MAKQISAKVYSDLRDHLILIVILGFAILLRTVVTG
jgi:hypothetical protein